MPTLNANQLLKLAGYLQRPGLTRDGLEVPNTSSGNIYQYACWSWALTGGTASIHDRFSANKIFETIVLDDLAHLPDPEFASAIANVDNQFPGCNAEFLILRTNLANAKLGIVAAQNAFLTAMVTISARVNGLQPGPVAGARYTLHIKSISWHGWDHWGIGIKLGPNNTQTYVQTVTDCPVKHACDRMWDEHRPFDISIDIGNLLQSQVDFLAKVKLAPCCQCVNLHSHGWLPSVKNFWQQCQTCGATYCSQHAAALGGALNPSDTTRNCNRLGCVGRTARTGGSFAA
jgi:hypothetical protein